MPRQRSLITVIRDMVQQEVRSAIQSLFGGIAASKTRAKNGRRRRRRRTRGTWRPGGPGRPPKAVAEKMAHKKAAAATSGSRADQLKVRGYLVHDFKPYACVSEVPDPATRGPDADKRHGVTWCPGAN